MSLRLFITISKYEPPKEQLVCFVMRAKFEIRVSKRHKYAYGGANEAGSSSHLIILKIFRVNYFKAKYFNALLLIVPGT